MNRLSTVCLMLLEAKDTIRAFAHVRRFWQPN
jgi:hypothetical protein